MADDARIDMYASLETWIRKAFVVKPYQKLTGPDWMREQWFEVAAKLPDGATQAQVPEMLRAVLVERLNLVMRREAKEQPVYILTVGKDGAHLKEATAGANSSSEWITKLNGGT